MTVRVTNETSFDDAPLSDSTLAGMRQDRVELVELSERCKAPVEDALRRGTN